MFMTYLILLIVASKFPSSNFTAIYKNTYIQETLERRSLVLFATLQLMLFNLLKRSAFLHTVSVSGLYQDAALTIGSEHYNIELVEALHNFHRVIVLCVWRYLKKLLAWFDILFCYRAFLRSLHFYYGAVHAIFQIYG